MRGVLTASQLEDVESLVADGPVEGWVVSASEGDLNLVDTNGRPGRGGGLGLV